MNDNTQDTQPTNAAPTGAASDQVTPQEQQAYNQVVTAAMKVIYDKSTHDGIMTMLKSGASPADALAHTASVIVTELDRQSGNKMPDTVILPAASEILGELVHLSTQAKIFNGDQKVVMVAMQKMVMNLGAHYNASPDDIKSLLQSTPKDQIQKIVSEQSGASQGQPAPGA